MNLKMMTAQKELRLSTILSNTFSYRSKLKIILLIAYFGFFNENTFGKTEKINTDTTVVQEKSKGPGTITIGEKKFKITSQFQLWNIYTYESIEEQSKKNHNDLYIRRGRLGVKGDIAKDLAFSVIFSYDGIGRDENTAGRGNPNPDDNHDFFLFEALTTWKYKPMLNITAGFFRPQVGREQITAPFKVISFEYALSNFQTRTHLVGRGTGRELGVNVGGLYKGADWSFSYNVGLFDISSKKLTGSTPGSIPMVTSRMTFTLGDPEMEKYGLGLKQSFYGKRKGITFGLNGSYKGETAVFESNRVYGGDILANYGPWDFMIEYDWLARSTYLDVGLDNSATAATTDRIHTYKLAYNILLKNGRIIQATGMYTGQLANDYGETDGYDLLTGASNQTVYEVGLNYLINKDNLKLSLHYSWGERTDKWPEDEFAYLGVGFQYLF